MLYSCLKGSGVKYLTMKLKKKRNKPASTATSAEVVASRVDVPTNESVPTLDTHNQDGERSLEGLPPELRRIILSLLDLHCLKALVHASPTFHQQYLHDRRHVLSASLEVTLGSIGFDACMLRIVQNMRPRTQEDGEGLLDTWRELLPYKSSLKLYGVINEDAAVSIVHQYFNLVFPVARCFMEKVLGSLRSTARASHWYPGLHSAPTKIEWQRCLRATYRFELLCCAVRPGLGSSDETPRTNATHLFYTPEQWEGEELLIFYQFAVAIYDDIFARIATEIHPNNPFRPDSSLRTYTFVDYDTVRQYLEGTTLRGGLRNLRQVLVDIRPDQQDWLVCFMQLCIRSSDIPLNTASGILSGYNHKLRLEQAPSRWDKPIDERAPPPFRADEVDQPPWAWTDILNRAHSEDVEDLDQMREWGYVFWDAERMAREGGRHLMKSWFGRWSGNRMDLY